MKFFNSVKIPFFLFLASVAISFGLYQIGFVEKVINKIELTVSDARFILRDAASDEKTVEDVIIVDIDEKSISKLGRFSSWPLAYFGDVLSYVAQGGAKSVAFDFFFTEPDKFDQRIIDLYTNVISSKSNLNPKLIKEVLENLETEEEFAEALKNSGVSILGAFDNEKTESSENKTIPQSLTLFPINKHKYLPEFRKIVNPKFPIEKLSLASPKIGFAHIYPDEDGITRRFDTFFNWKGKLVINFSMQMIVDAMKIDSVSFDEKFANLFSGNSLKLKIPVNQNGTTSLNYYGKQKTFRYLSFSDVLKHRLDSTFFKNKFVVVGASAVGLHDLKTIPFDSDYPGPELHATFVENALRNDFLHELPSTTKIILDLMIIFLAVIFFWKPSIKYAVSIYVFCGILLFIITYILFSDYHTLANFSSGFYFMSVTFFITIIYRYSTEVKEKQKIKNAFSKYVTNSIMDDMLSHPEKLVLGGEIKNVTALFSDIKNFTNLSEIVTPTDLTEFLKKYMTELTDIILKNNGMLDKYIGDSIVALFGAPIPFEHHPEDACLSAIKMKIEADKISSSFSNPNFKTVFTRIGINTGDMIVGNMGSEQLFDYTGIGDNMNLASRLEGLNKYYGTQILISESTKNNLSDLMLVREIDKVAVKGKLQGVRVFELFSHKEYISKEEMDNFNELKKFYEEALQFYYQGRWDSSIKTFEEINRKFPNDFASLLLLDRSRKFAITPPTNWEGVMKMESK